MMSIIETKTKLIVTGFTVVLLLVQGALAEKKAKKSPHPNSFMDELKFKAGDESGNELKALKTELLVSNSEQKALAQLNRLLKKYKGTKMEPEILLRLAELYMRRARSQRFFEVHRNSDQVTTFAPQLVKTASAAKEIRVAIVIYEKIQKTFPRFHSMDVVLFNNAFARQQVGDEKGAEKIYLRIVRDHTSSSLVPDSYLALGEITYGRRSFKEALGHFQEIRKFPEARVYPYGLYKAAWCYYNMQDARSGMKQLEEVVKFGQEVAREQLDAKLDLRKEALGDLALFFGDVLPSSKGVDYFIGQAADLDPSPYILRLSELYKRHSRFQDVETVLKAFIEKLPKSESIAIAHEELVWNYERTKKRSEAVAQLHQFDAYCEKMTSEKSKSEKEAMKDVVATSVAVSSQEWAGKEQCQERIADSSKKLSSKWHALWNKTEAGSSASEKFSETELSVAAEKAYRLYLKNASKTDDELPQMRFAFAELLFRKGEFREASSHYAALDSYRETLKVDGQLAHNASYASIVSLEKAVNDKWNDKDEQVFVGLAKTYVERFPKGPYVNDIQFKRAFIAYEKGRYDEAAPEFKKLGWVKPANGKSASEKTVKAQDLYLDILNIKKNYTELKNSALSLLSLGLSVDRKSQVQKIYQEAYFAEVQQMEEREDFVGAVAAYKKFALENSKAELASKAWWNASQIEFQLGDARGGANTCYQMHKLFPKSSKGRECLNQAAQTFEAMGQLGLAARVLLNLADVEVEKQERWRELAADFFALSGDRPRAIAMYLKMAETKDTAKLARYLEKANHVAKELNDQKTLRILEERYTKLNIEPQASRIQVEEAEKAVEAGDHAKAFQLAKKIVGRSELPAELQARARFVQALVLESEYRSQSVKARIDRIGIVLALKTEKLEKAQKAYQSTIAYGEPLMSVKALQQLAGCYLDYAKSARSMSLPDDVAEADQKAFKGEIESLAIPMEEKGIEAMNQALQTAKKAQLRDGQIAKLQVQLDKLNLAQRQGVESEVRVPSAYLPVFATKGLGSLGSGL